MSDDHADPCQACGACCSFSHRWPRFTTETDAEIALVPPAFVNERGTGMHCSGDRCSALVGVVGTATACAAYSTRPDVCEACKPGDAECNMARERFGLPALAG